jgi:hypothetical protein
MVNIERLPRLHRASPSAFLDKLNGKEQTCGMQAWRKDKLGTTDEIEPLTVLRRSGYAQASELG